MKTVAAKPCYAWLCLEECANFIGFILIQKSSCFECLGKVLRWYEEKDECILMSKYSQLVVYFFKCLDKSLSSEH